MIPLFVLFLLVSSGLVVSAQGLPASIDEPQERIVAGRPALHSFKRAVHPLTWIETSFRPIFHSAERGFIHRLVTRSRNPFFRIGLDGAGAGSGFGGKLTLTQPNLWGSGIQVEVPLLYTYKRYERYGLDFRVPLATDSPADRRLAFDFGLAYESRAADRFFGIGNDSRLEDESRFRAVTREVRAVLSMKVNNAWWSGVRVSYRSTGISSPRQSPSAQDAFRHLPIDGLHTGGVLGSVTLTLDRDTRERGIGLPVRGAFTRFEAAINEGFGTGDFSYWTYRVEAQRFFALTADERKVIAFRGMVETNQEKGGRLVPFFDMPVLGNWDTLRGFENYRFYDKSATAVSIEYRYRIWRPMDFALFADAGQVAPEPGDFGFNRFRPGFGVRIIGVTKSKMPISVDIARSSEKWRWYVNFNPNF